MNDITIPGWAVYLLAVLIPANIGWLIYLTLQINKNAQDIAVNTANDRNVSNELTKINENIREMGLQSNRSFDKLEKRIDDFLGAELAFLKNLTTK